MHKSILQYLCKITGTCVLVGLGLKRTFALVVVLLYYYYNTTLCCVLYCTIIVVIVVLYCYSFVCLFVCSIVQRRTKDKVRGFFLFTYIVKFLTNSSNKRQATCLVSKWLSHFFSFYFLIFIVLAKNCPFIFIDVAPPNSVLPAVPKHKVPLLSFLVHNLEAPHNHNLLYVKCCVLYLYCTCIIT